MLVYVLRWNWDNYHFRGKSLEKFTNETPMFCVSQHSIQKLPKNFFKAWDGLYKQNKPEWICLHTSKTHLNRSKTSSTGRYKMTVKICDLWPPPLWPLQGFPVCRHRHHLHHSPLAAQTHFWCEYTDPRVYKPLWTPEFQAAQEKRFQRIYLFFGICEFIIWTI